LPQIKILDFLNKSQMLAARRLAAKARESLGEDLGDFGDFFTAIETSNSLGISSEQLSQIWKE
jgi:hypothetical protein